MIAYVAGRVAELTDQSCVVVTAGGVGYEVFVSQPFLMGLTRDSGDINLYICTVVREDALELFGFATWDERETFALLRTINRVGPRTAMAILSVYSPDDLVGIVANEDVLALTQVPGIGKKTGQQIFLELKYKLEGRTTTSPSGSVSKIGGVGPDAVAGLLNLGYAEQEAQNIVKQVLQESPGLDVGSTLRLALKKLAGNNR